MKLNYKFKNKKLLELALTHPSMSKNGVAGNYERLEFLGDSVIGLVVADMVYKRFGDLPEGKLALIHSTLVRKSTLAKIAEKLALGKYLIMDYGEAASGGRENPKNLEDALEALIGAIYLDSSFTEVQEFMVPLWSEHFSDNLAFADKDAKSELQEWAQKLGKPIPEYKVINQTGAPHNPTFTIELHVEGLKPLQAKGSSKKEAQILVATKMLAQVNDKISGK